MANRTSEEGAEALHRIRSAAEEVTELQAERERMVARCWNCEHFTRLHREAGCVFVMHRLDAPNAGVDFCPCEVVPPGLSDPEA